MREAEDVRSVRGEDERAGSRVGLEQVLSAGAATLGVVLVGLFLYAVLVRATSPADAEWMTGAIRDHVERVRDGLPLYTAPSAEHVPFIYPPLYYWVAGALAKVMPLKLACRAVSVASTLAAALAVRTASRGMGASRYWAAMGALTFIASYPLTSYFFDLERVDALFVALVAWATALALRSRTTRAIAIAGALLGVAFLAKQMAAAILLAGAAGLFAARRRRDALAFLAGGAVVVFVACVALHVQTSGWFTYYCVRLPRTHGMESRRISQFFVFDLAKGFALTLATFHIVSAAVVCGWGALRRSPQKPSEDRESLVRDVPDRLVPFAALVLGAAAASASARLHGGGWPNVIMAWVCLASIALAVTGERLDRRGASARLLVRGIVGLQLLAFVYDPNDANPLPKHDREAREVARVVRELEAEGEVVLAGRGGVTTPRHMHLAALADVLRAGDPLPEDLVLALRSRKYAAYIIDEPYELTFESLLGRRSELFEIVMRHYYYADRFDDEHPPPAVGFEAHPTWILKRRARPLEGASAESLERLQAVEMGLAHARMKLRAAGIEPGANDIEVRAATLVGLAPP